MLFFQVLVLDIIITGFVCAELILSPSSPRTTENSSLTLTCTHTGNETITAYTWKKVRKNETLYNNIGVITSECKDIILPVDYSLYEYACPSSKQYTWTIKRVTRQNEGERYQCVVDKLLPGMIESNEFVISVQVAIRSLDLITPSSSTITVRENKETDFKCKTSGGLPKAIITWFQSGDNSSHLGNEVAIDSKITTSSVTINGLIEVTSTLRYTPSRNDNNRRIYCKASNIAGQPLLVSTRKPQIHVQYPPDLPIIIGFMNGEEYRVIEKEEGHILCNVSGGYPAPILSWDCYNIGTSVEASAGMVSKGQTWIAVRGQDKTCTCSSSHYSGTKSVSIKIVILYPPTAPTFKIHGAIVTGIVRVIKNNELSISCISSGNPSPSYTWTYPNSPNNPGQVLTINSVQSDKTLICNAQNTINPTYGENATHRNSTYIDVLVLYPPIIGELNDINIAEGSPLTVLCPVTVGNPTQTTYHWLRNGVVWNRSQQFSIETVTRTDAMLYTCTISNTMVATGEKPVSSEVVKSFYLNVWYSATIKDFYISGHQGQISVIKNEDDRLQFNCLVDSNPGSSTSLTYMKDVLKTQTDSKQLIHTIHSAKCTMGGVYICEGFNAYNINPSYKTIHLFVNCSPRPSPSTILNENVTSSQNVTAVLTFTTLAYPDILEFTWYRWYNNLWQQISNDGEYQIYTLNEETNLIISHVNKTHYGKYQLQATNTVGTYTQLFYLKAEEKLQHGETDTCSCCSIDSILAIIIGCVLGIVIILLSLYASYIRILLKRKEGYKGQNEINLASSDAERGTIYANLSFSTAESRQYEFTEMSNTVTQSLNTDSSEYMELQSQFRDNRETYHVINVNR